MAFEGIKHIHFLGIGGIGMSAVARYFHSHGFTVTGYDKTATPLTDKLQAEGIFIVFEDNEQSIPKALIDTPSISLVVITPAIPANNNQLAYFTNAKYTIKKRSQVLGEIVNSSVGLAVAGTHGKTTISTMLAHLLTHSGMGCNAFLGGIASNYGTNHLANATSNLTVVEADEFDRSFLTLNPTFAAISSLDADHLDIYEDADDLRDTFIAFGNQVAENGTLITKKELGIRSAFKASHKTYSIKEEADYWASNITVRDGQYHFDLHIQNQHIPACTLGLPGRHNVENAVAAAAIAYEAGMTGAAIKSALATFRGVHRRFDVHVSQADKVYIDDYAHHPTEITACLQSVREMYGNRKITGVFQPHLFTRTRDFADDFAESLALLDKIILLPIYPAREKPIPGIDSQMLLNKIPNTPSELVQKSELLGELELMDIDVLVTLGAGDIDQLVKPITSWLST